MSANGNHAALVKAIRKLVEGDGGFLVKYPGGPLGPRGVADFLGVHRGRPVAIEVKCGKDRLSAEQTKFLVHWNQAGGLAIVARDVAEVAKALEIPLLL